MADLTQIASALNALDAKQVRILTGTVTGTSTNSNTIPVRLDNDGTDSNVVPIVIPSIIGLIEVGARVSIIVIPPAGMMIAGIIGADFNVQALWDYQVLVTNNTVWENPRVYVANDTWNKPTNPLFLGVKVKIQSGGGGSGGTGLTTANTSRNSTAAGGQGGGYIEILVLAASLTSTVTVTIGAGGTAGASPSGNGGTGGTSSFGTYGSIPGGEGGTGGGVLGGVAVHQTTQEGGNDAQASSVAGGAVLLDYQQGDDGGQGSRWGGLVDNAVLSPGFGGGCRMAGITKTAAITSASTNPQIAPVAGWPFGGGASGRGAGPGVAAGGGAAGGQGIVIVSEFYRT